MKKVKKILALTLSVLMLFTSVSVIAGAASVYTPQGDFRKISETEHKIAPGVSESRLILNKESGTQQETVYAVTVDTSLSTTGFMAGYADYNGNTWKLQTVRDQAAAAAAARDENIVVAVNADIFNMSTGEPTGVLVMNGKVYKSALGRPYFGVTKDGKIVVGQELTQEVLDTLQEAISGFYMIVQDGKRWGPGENPESNIAPKTCIGIKEDGSVVVVTVDGRNYPISCSLSDYDLATIMLDLGCKDVINLDGGGSTTYLAKYEGESVLGLKNKPSDFIERKVSSTLFITSSAVASGEFDHASLLPNNDVYTPGSEVQFSATGVDPSGAAAPLPEDGSFALADESFGTITADGLFVSGGKTGTVTVNYISDGKPAGSTTIEVQEPDEISFTSEEISLGFSKESTLGLTVKYQGQDVNYRAEDIVFTMSDPTMGTFDGLVFTSSPSATINGTITAKYVGNPNVKATVNMIIGRLPTVVLDFEDIENTDGSVILAEDYYTFTKGTAYPDGGFSSLDDPTAKLAGTTYNRGGSGNTAIVDISSGEPVRFGNKALKVNFDFTQCGAVTEGFAVGPTEASSPVDGIPTAIGMWVYAPEGTPNLWLRVRVKDGSNTTANLDFVPQTKDGVNGGIDWQGWKYVEASLEGWTGPFSLMGGELIRLMYVYGITMGFYTKNEANEWIEVPQANRKGSLYIDNVQFVYGANVDDIDNPLVTSIQANLNEITNNMEVDTNTVSFRATYADVQNNYTTGVDPSTVAIFIDGVEMTHKDNCFLLEGDETIRLENVELANGPHTVKVRVRDGFGNETVESRTFIVNGDKEYPSIRLEPVDEKPILGRDFSLALKTEDASAVEKMTSEIRIDPDFTDFTVAFADGFTGTYAFDAKTKTITLNAEKTGEVTGDTIATLTFAVPGNLDQGKTFTYAVPSGSATYTGDYGENFVGGFSANQKAVEVAAAYAVSFDPMVVGFDGVIYVKDMDGKPVEGAVVSRLDDESGEIGTTDAEGKLVTGVLTDAVQSFVLQATVDTSITFKVSGQSTATALAADGTPEYVMANAVENASAEENISWLSNPAGTDAKAVIRYAAKADYDKDGEAAFDTVDGKTALHQFLGSSNIENNYAVRVNSAVLTGLSGNTEYVYQVGDGKVFSETYTFRTTRAGADTNFFIIGDAQATQEENFKAILKSLKEDGTTYDFGIQTGDSVEVANVLGDWTDVLGMFSDEYLRTVDILHVFGNHEYMSDPEGVSAQLIYNVPDESHYSVEYGNVYVATISYTTDMAKLDAALEWLKADAAASNCQWKILTIHQPPYYTHTAGGNELIHEKVPAAAEAAGIQVVFSGHDHSYARTRPLKNGEVDEENGIVYYICGSTGDKAYPVQDTGFAFDVKTQEFSGLYLTVNATDEKLTIVPHNLDGTEFEEAYVIEAKTACVKDGHTYNYNAADGYLECTVCGHAEPLGEYSGFAKDKDTGRNIYFEGGKEHTGWLNYGSDVYYFDETGLSAPEGKLTLEVDDPTSDGKLSIEYEFDADGKQKGGAFVHVEKYDIIRCYRGENYVTGWYELDGDTYYFGTQKGAKDNGKMYTGKKKIKIFSGQEITYVFDKNGRLTDFAWCTDEEGMRLYWGQNAVMGWKDYKGETYYFDPATALMKTGEQTIDGKDYAFADDGKLLHEGKHNFEKTGHTDYSCTTDEVDTYTCSICKVTEDRIVKATAGHELELHAAVEPTATAAGNIAYYSCKVCGKLFKDDAAKEEITAEDTVLAPVAPDYKAGDVDGDGEIKANDARLALRASVKLEAFWEKPDDAKFKASDTDQDGKISASDARHILRAAVKLEKPEDWKKAQ